MLCNIMDKYIKYAQKEITSCMKLIMADRFNKEIFERFLDTYIQARYYDFGVDEKQKITYRRIYYALKEEEIKLLKEHKNKDDLIKHTLAIYQYIFYIDEVREIADLKEFVNRIYDTIIKTFNSKPEPKFKSMLYKIIKDGQDAKQKFLTGYDTDEFILNISKYILIKDLYKSDLGYNFKIPYIYSKKAIMDVFNENVVNEDKLIIEYILLTIKCVQEVIDSNFKTKYTVVFDTSFFQKKNKLNQILRIINNQVILDKIKLKINYKEFIKHKDKIYGLMQDGYKFVIVLDEKFKITNDNITKLNIFDFIIISRKQNYYDELMEYEEIQQNIVIDD